MPGSDELCAACADVDLFALFTGPRYYPGEGHHSGVRVPVGTLEEVKKNDRCPLCRLIKHDLYGSEDGTNHPWKYPIDDEPEPNPFNIRCFLYPIRVDYTEDTKYLSAETRDMLATRVEVRLQAVPSCSEEEATAIRRHARGPGILLLSPESVDPARPLLNGFRATTVEKSLPLLSTWLDTCHREHGESCHLESTVASALEPTQIRVIDVDQRKLVDHDIADVTYAALSYVWGQGRRQHSTLADGLLVGEDEAAYLPLSSPKIVEDALLVCKALSIPYLWVDLYCLHQKDAGRKAAEIKAMGSIYRRAHITLVAGSPGKSDHRAWEGRGLLSRPLDDDVGSAQRTETIGNRRYISALTSITRQIQASKWIERGWTFQEGQMARRVAFFGSYEISFLCGAGHWRESFHSGPFGHEAKIPGIDLRSEGYYILSALNWLRSGEWNFNDYSSVVLAYSQRVLSYESDRLDAVSGCLNVVAQKKGMRFLCGLPSVDFHYALLWHGQFDRPRAGFPSWSWAGWYAMNNMHVIHTKAGGETALTQAEDGRFSYESSVALNAEMEGVLLRPALESAHRENKCAQKLASLSVSESNGTLTVMSEVAGFFIDIPASSGKRPDGSGDWSEGKIPVDFDTTGDHYATDWKAETEYRKPYKRMLLRDSSGNVYREDVGWVRNGPVVLLELPSTLRGSTLTWLLRDGIELIRIVELEFLEGHEEMKAFHHVMCLGIDRSEGVRGQGRRMGMFIIPKEAWVKAGPREMQVTFR